VDLMREGRDSYSSRSRFNAGATPSKKKRYNRRNDLLHDA